MKTKRIINLILALGATYLLYSETAGLNILILSVLSIISFGIVNPIKMKTPGWWASAALLFLNGFSVFYLGKTYHIVLFILALTLFVAVSHSTIKTFYFLIYDTFRNTLINFTNLLSSSLDILVGNDETKSLKSLKWLRKSLIVLIPALLFFAFLQLYRLSSSNFDELSNFISFDWISPSWVALFALFYILFYTWLYFKPDEILARFEHQKSRKIVLGRADTITKFLTREFEVKLAIAITASLSLLLVFLVISDFILFSKSELYSNGLDFISNELHNGVYALIVSILLTVALVSFILRGNLNFFQPTLINIAMAWLVLNMIVVISNFYKNWIYVDLGGLTYKRVGVFIYLIMTFIGLAYTLFKVAKKERFFYIFRTTGISFFAVISLALAFNWDIIITNYNLSDKFSQEEIDYTYLLCLKEGNQHILIQKAEENKIPKEYLYEIYQVEEDYFESKSWKSLVYSEHVKNDFIAKHFKSMTLPEVYEY